MAQRTLELLLGDLWVTASGVQIVSNTGEEGTTTDGDCALGHGC